MDRVEIVMYTTEELEQAERSSDRVRSASPKGSMDYADRVGEFLFWMNTGVRPANAREGDFRLYRLVAEELVKKGQFKPSVLAMFEQPVPCPTPKPSRPANTSDARYAAGG